MTDTMIQQVTRQQELPDQRPFVAESHDDPRDPRAFMVEMRRRALSRKEFKIHNNSTNSFLFGEDEGVSLEHLIRTCRGLIATTHEIWSRCQPYCCGTIPRESEAGSSTRTNKLSTSSTSSYLFVRLAHSTVHAFTKTSSSSKRNSLVFQSAMEITKQVFEIPVTFPSTLYRLVPVPKIPSRKSNSDEAIFDIMPNLGLLLKRSMLLSEEILVVFLKEYKEYLENLQVALGNVDAWLLVADECHAFLNQQFGQLPWLEEDESEHYELLQSYRSINGSLSDLKSSSEVCSRCSKRLSKHHLQRGWGTCLYSNQEAFFPISHANDLIACKNVPYGSHMEVIFGIDQVENRKRLVKFLNFAKSGSPSKLIASSSSGEEDSVADDEDDQETEEREG